MSTTSSEEYRKRSFTSQDGLRLSFRDYGDPLSKKTPLLCLGGLTRNASDFHDLAQRLKNERRILAPDYRGRGRSEYDPDWRNYHPRVYLNDIRHLLAATGVHRVAVLGTSLGGILAMTMGAAIPTALAGVILNDVGPDIHAPGLARILTYIRKDRPQPNWPAAAKHLKALMPALSIKTAAGWEALAHRTYREGADGALHFDWDINIAKQLQMPQQPPQDLWPFYRAIRHLPVLAFRGELSDILTTKTFERMAMEKPDLVQVTVMGCGHVPLLDEPPATVEIEHFLDRLDLNERAPDRHDHEPKA